MREIDLALYADVLAGEAASLAARIKRERGNVRQAAVETAARKELPLPVVEQLEELGLLATRADVARLAVLEEALDAIDLLQAWVEAALSRAAA
jgi:hypothetical protein